MKNKRKRKAAKFIKRMRYELSDLRAYVCTRNFYTLLLATFAGLTLFSIGTNAVVLVFGLVPSGLAGTTVLLYYILGEKVPLGILYLVINIPIFILGWQEYPMRQLVVSLIGMLMLSFLLEITKGFQLQLPDNPVLTCIMAGLILGAGLGFVVRSGGSGGGQRILAMYLKKKLSVPMTSTFNLTNGINLLGALFFTNLETLMYSALYMWVFSVVFERIITSFSQKRAVQIITNQPEQVAKAIMERLRRGVTFFQAAGAFSKKNLKIVYCIVHLHELGQVKKLVFECDPKAFLAVYVMSETVGGNVSPSVTWENEGYRKMPESLYPPVEAPIFDSSPIENTATSKTAASKTATSKTATPSLSKPTKKL